MRERVFFSAIGTTLVRRTSFASGHVRLFTLQVSCKPSVHSLLLLSNIDGASQTHSSQSVARSCIVGVKPLKGYN